MVSAQGWTFTSTVTAPDGLRASATVELPPGAATERPVADTAELTQIAATTLANRIRKLIEEMPF